MRTEIFPELLPNNQCRVTEFDGTFGYETKRRVKDFAAFRAAVREYNAALNAEPLATNLLMPKTSSAYLSARAAQRQAYGAFHSAVRSLVE